MQVTHRSRLAIAAALLAACGRAPTAVEDPQAAVCARVAEELARFAVPGNYYWENDVLERLIPGRFVGGGSSPAGNAIVLMQPDSLVAAKATAGRAAECPGGERFHSLGGIGSAVVALQGRYPWSTLRAWDTQLLAAVGPTPGISMHTIDAGEGQLRFVVEDVAIANRIAAEALRLGIPPGVPNVQVYRFWFDGGR